MTHFGLYEAVVERALAREKPAPWTVEDLHQSEKWITDEQCSHVYPNCRPEDVLDWLRSFSPAELDELISHLNFEQAAKHQSSQ